MSIFSINGVSLHKSIKLFFITVSLLLNTTLFAAYTGNANGYTPKFEARKNLKIPGGLAVTGNTILVAPNTGGGAGTNKNICSTYTNGAYINDATKGNNNYYICKYYIDGIDASTAQLDINDTANSTIVWAGLYWQAQVHKSNSGLVSGGTSLSLKNGSDSYVTVNSDMVRWVDAGYDDSNGNDMVSYSAFANVTNVLTANNWKDGNYTVHNVAAFEGKVDSLGNYGAWTLVVIYKNLNESLKSFDVFDGWKVVRNKTGFKSVPINISGFYTPKSGKINSKVSIFVAEGDKHISGDYLKAENKNAGPNPKNINYTTTGGSFKSAVTGVSYRLPSPLNNNGIDIQTHEIGTDGYNLLTNEQSNITFTFTSNQDTYWPSMIAFATEIYEPKFCYDFSAVQNNIQFEKSTALDPTVPPWIYNENLSSSGDINVSLYIRNTEDSDVSAENVELNITDINTSMATYVSDTTTVTYTNNFFPTSKTDAAWPLVASSANILGIPLTKPSGAISGQQHVYSSYTLHPDSGISDNNFSLKINAEFTYDLRIPIDSQPDLVIPYHSILGSDKLPLCSGGTFNYDPSYGEFNVVDAGLNSNMTGTAGESPVNNLPTQVVRRPGSFYIVTYDKDNSEVTKPLQTAVGLELIEIKEFQTTEAACGDPSSAISERFWFRFTDPADTRKLVDATVINNKITSQGIFTMPNGAEDFFPQARKNTAFRIITNRTNDGNDSLVDISTSGNILNFTELVQDVGNCARPVQMKQSDPTKTTEKVSVACANASGDKGSDMTDFELRRCMECILGVNSQATCSRDNFATRPESFDIKLSDVNQTLLKSNPTLALAGKQKFATDRTGNATNNNARVHLATGYDYHYDINATSHTSSNSVPGYTQYFGNDDADYNITLIFDPLDPTKRSSSICNDNQNHTQKFDMINGVVSQEGNYTNVGEYRLDMIDSSFTEVDSNPIFMVHHNSNGFIGDKNTPDCVLNNSDVPNLTALPVAHASSDVSFNYTNIAGCNISSNHQNSDLGISYVDYNLTFHPYKIDVSELIMSHGLAEPLTNLRDTNFTAPVNSDYPFVYMANINGIDEDMSLRYEGNITAVDYNGSKLSNFTDQCYAEQLNIDLNRTVEKDAVLPIDGANYTVKFRDYNLSSNLLLSPIQFKTINNSAVNNILTIPTTSFPQAQGGLAKVAIMLNFDRNISKEINPIRVIIDDLNVSCFPLANCQSQADFSPTHDVNGTQIYDDITSPYYMPNRVVAYYYATLYSRPYTVFSDDMNATINYTVYCNNAGTHPCNAINYPKLLAMTDAPDTIRHKINSDHNDTRDGQLTSIDQNSTLPAPLPVQHKPLVTPLTNLSTGGSVVHNIVYDGTQGHSYTATIDVNASEYLMYNPVVQVAQPFQFKIRFKGSGLWSGVNEHNASSSKTESGINTNRRINW